MSVHSTPPSASINTSLTLKPQLMELPAFSIRQQTMNQLPVELLALVASALDDLNHNSIKALRSVSKACSDVCTPLLFCEYNLLLRSKSIKHLTNILDSPRLCCKTTHLSINTAEYTDTCLNTFDWKTQDAELLANFLAALMRVGRMQNLRSVKLKFSHECVGLQERRLWGSRSVPESLDFREDTLQRLFHGLNSTPKIEALCIENLQACNHESLVRTRKFQAVMPRLRKLELQITTGKVDDDGSLPDNLGQKEPHEFFGHQLVQNWLEPVSHQLTHLKLYSRNMYFGYLPRCQLPHFPALESLILGGMTFSHDAQLEWLLTHANTLQEIIFDNCPIVIGVRIPSTLDSDNYPIEPLFNYTTSGSFIQWSSFRYPLQWSDFFDRLAKGLPCLRSIRCGFGDWYDGNAFPASKNLGTVLWAQRYRLFDNGEWRRPPFPEGPHNIESGYEGGWLDPPKYPECTDEDWLSLCELKKVTEARLQ